MALPLVSLLTGQVGWAAPTKNTDGSAIPSGELTGFVVGLRSLTVANSAVGTYPIVGPPVPATQLNDSFQAIGQSLRADDYAAVVKATSVNGDSAWSNEIQFTGVLPVPNPPDQVTVS